jgi:beta-galactosidase
MPPTNSPSPVRERLTFNAAWRFHREKDSASAAAAIAVENRNPSAIANRFEDPAGPTAAAFDDTAWRELDLPHDWGVDGAFDPDLPGRTGRLPWAGIGWYRKTFRLPATGIASPRVELEFEGAMSHTEVWCNGHRVGHWVYGYTTFRVDLTTHLHPDGDNVVAVRLANPPDSSRWYPGAGLYRPVWLHLTHPTRIAPWGVFVSTPEITDDEALVRVDTIVESSQATAAPCVLTTRIHLADEEGEPAGPAVATADACEISPGPIHGQQVLRSQTLRLASPRRWDITAPHRYVAVCQLRLDDVVVDALATPFGVRSIEFKPDDGFHLNGRRVPIQGVCLHHDLGALGAAFDATAAARQLRLLRELGCNAIRTAHNPPAPGLLELCDRLGFLVMDEAFDCWRLAKSDHDYGHYFDAWHDRDLRAMVRRDRNHPSVILWSIGNEILDLMHDPESWKLGARLAGIVREEDRTRPVTFGCNFAHTAEQGMQSAVDLIGFNYKPWAYADFHQRHPQVPVYGSETSSCISTRDTYVFPVSDDPSAGTEHYQVSSYDLCAPSWASPPDAEFAGLDDAPHAAGEFVWTGFDYLGEPTPFNEDVTNLLNFADPADRERMTAEIAALGRVRIPSRSSYFGILDLAGFPKDRYHLYQARWRPELPVAHLLPHWNWAGREGEITPVFLYTNGDEAELFVNGRSLGTRRRGPRDYRLRWDDVRYEPGELHALVTRAGQPWAGATRRTTAAPAAVRLIAEPPPPGVSDPLLQFVQVEIVDAEGAIVPTADPELLFSLTGPGTLEAIDAGDPTQHRAFRSTALPAFRGRCLVIIRSETRTARWELTVTTESLLPATLRP